MAGWVSHWYCEVIFEYTTDIGWNMCDVLIDKDDTVLNKWLDEEDTLVDNQIGKKCVVTINADWCFSDVCDNNMIDRNGIVPDNQVD